MRRLLALLLCLSITSLVTAEAPPDLRLRWKDSSSPVRGPAGAKIDLAYELTNIGGSPAFAVIVKAHTTVGPIGTPSRIQPGPAAGATMRKKVSFPLVRGMREICVDAVLQHRASSDPPEPNLENNRICRAISVDPQSASGEVSR